MALSKLRASIKNTIDRNAYNSICGKFIMTGGKIQSGFKTWPVGDCTLELHDNGTLSNQPAGNVFISGGVPTINTSGWLILHTPDGEKRSRIIGNEITRARTFAMNFELEKERTQRQHQV